MMVLLVATDEAVEVGVAVVVVVPNIGGLVVVVVVGWE
jgi:hypothetical protein